MNACLSFITVAGVSYGTVAEHIVGRRVEVHKLRFKSAKHINSGVDIIASLVLGKELCKLDKSASGNSRRSGVVINGLCGCSEINTGQPIIAAICDKVISNKLSGIEVSLFTRVNI